MKKLNLYYVNDEYLNTLNQCELDLRGFSRVPNSNNSNNNKQIMFCGPVLNINNVDYYAPITSFRKQMGDNFIIKNSNDEIVSSLRFNYMLPIPQAKLNVLKIDNVKDNNYKILLSQELRYCINNQNTINYLAKRTYKRVILGKNKGLVNNSCNFILLEKIHSLYNDNPKTTYFKLRESNALNSAFELMINNEALQDETYVGCFWYDPTTNELYGIGKQPSNDLKFYHSNDFNKYIKTGHQLHKSIWQKNFYRGKDKRFTGDYTLKPRGRVFEIKDEGFIVCVGDWYKDYPQAKDEIMFEFQLPIDNTKFVYDTHWDLGHGWSNDYLEDENINDSRQR